MIGILTKRTCTKLQLLLRNTISEEKTAFSATRYKFSWRVDLAHLRA